MRRAVQSPARRRAGSHTSRSPSARVGRGSSESPRRGSGARRVEDAFAELRGVVATLEDQVRHTQSQSWWSWSSTATHTLSVPLPGGVDVCGHPPMR